MVTNRQLVEDYGLSEEEVGELEARAQAYASGQWPDGKTTRVGRPRRFADEPVSISFKDTAETRSALDQRASAAGMSRSDYLRALVHADLAAV